jgi:hypothetical protein
MELHDTQMNSEAGFDSGDNSAARSSHAEVTLDPSSEQGSFELPIEQCPHCWSHSQPSSGSFAFVAIDPSRRSIQSDSLLASPGFVSPAVVPISIMPTEHGPPGLALPRHVLINVFRI